MHIIIIKSQSTSLGSELLKDLDHVGDKIMFYNQLGKITYTVFLQVQITM